jgi:hypothetical protein
MINGYVSIYNVISKIYRDLDINSEIPETSIVEWSAEALALIGAYSQYDEVSTCLDLTSGKVKLPLGFYKLVDINYQNYPIYWATNTNANNYQCSECKIPVCADAQCNYTFYVNDSYLITNITDDDASVCMVYLSVHVDENGYPMIPDDIYYVKAVTAYVISMIDYQDWRKGKIADKVYQKSEADWEFYVKSARAAGNMPNAAQLENLKNIMTRLTPLRNDYGKGFKNISNPERINSKT